VEPSSEQRRRPRRIGQSADDLAAKDDQEWMRLSQALVDASVEAIKAAEAKNVDNVFSAGGEIYAVCSDCHAKYVPEIANRVGND
jgi:cytochrome c556